MGMGGGVRKTPPVFPVPPTLKHWLNEPFFPTAKARENKVLLFLAYEEKEANIYCS